MNDAYVIGVGMTEFGRHPDKTLLDLGREACRLAIADAGISPKDIQTGFSGNVQGAVLQGELNLGQGILREVGVVGIPILNVVNSCATGACAFREAWLAVAAGICDIAIAIGTEKTFEKKGAMLNLSNKGDIELVQGAVFPGDFAIKAQRHMFEFGTTKEQMAKISVKNHRNGCLNPYAQYKKEFTVEDVLNSPMVADPLTVLSCCANSDGSAAAIVASRDIAMRCPGKVIRIAGSSLQSGTYDLKRNMLIWDQEARAAKIVYEMSGFGPKDIDVAEVHDAFTIAELMHYESLGFCAVGEGGRLIDEGATEIGGRIPVSASGGLLSRGHPIGASGVAQIAEIVWQLRGQAGARQVQNARIGLASILGGGRDGDAIAASVHILVKD